MWRTRWSLVVLSAVGLIAASCGGDDGSDRTGAATGSTRVAPTDPSEPLPAGTWGLLHSYGPSRDVGAAETHDTDGFPRMTVDTGASTEPHREEDVAWRGRDGCHDLELTVAITGAQLDVRDVTTSGVTDCSPDELAVAEAYREALDEIEAWSFDGLVLELTGPTSWVILEPLEPLEPVADQPGGIDPDDADLWGRVWTTSTIREDGVERSLVDGTELRLHLDHDGGQRRIGFNSGCNHFGGTLAISSGHLRWVEGGGTEMGCDEPLHDQDGLFNRFFFRAPVAWELDGNQLTLTAGDGAVLELEPGDEEAAADRAGPTA